MLVPAALQLMGWACVPPVMKGAYLNKTFAITQILHYRSFFLGADFFGFG